MAVYERTLDLSRLGPDLRPRRVSLLSPTVGRFTIEFSWNPRVHRSLQRALPGEDGAYFIRLEDDAGTVRIRGRCLTLSADHFASARAGDSGIPPGALSVVGPRDPGRLDLSDGACVVSYREEYDEA